MAKLKASELGTLIGKSRQYVNSNKARGNLIVDGDGSFDMENPINKEWHKRMRAKFIAEESNTSIIVSTPIKKINIESESETPGDVINEETPKHGETTFAIAKQQADLELKNLMIQEKQIELQKKQGKLLDAEFATDTTHAFMSMFKKTLHRDMETLIHKICDVYKVSLEDKSKYVNEVILAMNRSSDRTIEDLKNNLQSESDDVKN